MKKAFALFAASLLLTACPIPLEAAEGKVTLNFSVAVDESATLDRLVYRALEKMGGYDMSVEVFPMAYAIQMANNCEKDALVAQASGLEEEYPNLIMVPEPIGEVRFAAYARNGFARNITGWEDLRGLRVGSLRHKTYVESRLPETLKEHTYRESNAELIHALLLDECDVIIVAVSLDDALQVPDGIYCVRELERIPTYVYLNRCYEDLAPELSRAIAAIKADGSYQRIAAHENPVQRSILHISSYYADDSWEADLLEGVADVLSRQAGIRYENIALNANRSLNENNRSRSVSSMVRTLYLGGAPGVVIASDNAAVQFVMDYYNLLFYDVPVVFCGQNGDIDDQLWKIAQNGTGVYTTVPADDTVGLILELFPDTEQLFILNDYSEGGVEWRKATEAQLGTMPETKGLDITYNPPVPLDETLGLIEALPANSVVLCGLYSVDCDNRYYPQKELQARLDEQCSLPIFGMCSGGIGYGQLGGRYVEANQQGKTAAEYALAILDGKAAGEIPTLHDTRMFGQWVFDRNLLDRYGIDERALPAGSTIINGHPSLYQSNPRVFYLTLSLLVLGVLVIAVLSSLTIVIGQKNKRLMAVQKTLHSAEEMLEKDREIVAIAQRLEIALAVSDSGAWEINTREGLFHYDKAVGKALWLTSGNSMPIAHFAGILDSMQDGAAGSDAQAALLRGDLAAFTALNAPEFTLTAPDGTKRHYHNYVKTMSDENGRVESLVGLLVDTTRQVAAQQELVDAKETAESASRTKSQFLSNMSHEIRTPMNAILGMAELLSDEPLSARQTQFVHDINTSAAWLLEIINDLLDLSKVESGRLDLIPVNYSLGEMLDNLISMFAYTAQKKGIAFVPQKAGNLPQLVYGDDVRVRQILANVINNAVKYTPEGRVTFEARCDSANLCFTVSDTGIGIRQEDMPTIFDDYAQFDLRRNRGMSGTGLGLAITKRLVDKMGGAIVIESVYGEGTQVFITLPFVAGTADDTDLECAETCRLYAPDAMVLVVDDTDVNLTVAAGFLERFGIHCHTAVSGAQAIDMIRGTHYDLVFLDQMMPDMDGVETVQKLRAEGFTTDVLPVVALTANALSDAKAVLIEAGMDDFLPKPICDADLGRILQRWLPPSIVLYRESGGETAEEAPLDPLLAKVEKLDGIDIPRGLETSGGKRDAYLGLLKLTAQALPGNITAMERCLADEDVARLEIEAHGAKSVFLHIGAEALALKALEIEEHARTRDAVFCFSQLPLLLEGMSALERQLLGLFPPDAKPEDKAPGDIGALWRSLGPLQECIGTLDYQNSKQALAQISGMDFGTEVNRLIARAMEQVELFDFAAAATSLDAIAGILNGSDLQNESHS